MGFFDLFKTTAKEWFQEAQRTHRGAGPQLAIAADRDVARRRQGLQSNEHQTVSAKVRQRVMQCLNKAAQIDPGYSPAWLAKGEILLGNKQLDDALECLNKAVQGDPPLPDALYCQARALEQKQSNEEALRSYERALSIDAEDGEAWKGMARILASLGRKAEAEDCEQRARESKGRSLQVGAFRLERRRWLDLTV
jgi:tetratricopeptide (TPR) repeat protein